MPSVHTCCYSAWVKKTILLCAGVLITAGGLVFAYGSRPETNESPELPVLLSLASDPIPDLHPHEHTERDTVDSAGHGVPLHAQEIVTTEDLWVRGVRIAVKNAPRVTLHHLNVMVFPAVSAADAAGAFLQFNAPYGISVGQDIDETLLLSKPYATYIPKGSRIVLSGMMHNPEPPKGPGGDYADVSISVDLLGIDFRKTEAKRVQPLFLSLIDRKSPYQDSFEVPARSLHYTRFADTPEDVGRATYVFPTDGMLVELGAHLHAWEGGEKVEAYLNGNVIHTFVPRHAGMEPWDFATDRTTLMLRVKKGDVLSLSATYSNDHDEPLLGAMGILGGSFAPDIR